MDWVEFLHCELRERAQKNPRYSLRAFARDLGLSPSRLSELMRKQGNLSEVSAQAILRALSAEPSKAQHFALLYQSQLAKSELERAQAERQLQELAHFQKARALLLEEFAQMSEWYNLALWNYLLLPGRHLATELYRQFPDVEPRQIEQSLLLLRRLDLIEGDGERGYYAKQEMLTAFYQMGSFAVRNYHRSMLEKAQGCLHGQATEERFFLSSIFLIDQSQLPELQLRLQKVLKDLSLDLKKQQQDRPPNAVYAIGMQAFRLHDRALSGDNV